MAKKTVKAHDDDVFEILSRDEFETLALQQLDGLYAAALHLTRNEADARDLVQDTYLRALRFRHKFRAGTNFRGWIFKLMYRLFVNRYHKKVWERDHLASYDQQVITVASDSVRYNPEASTMLRLDVETLTAALQEVPEVYRTPLVLCNVNQFSYDEIATLLKVPIGTVMSRLFRGRKLLKERLSQLQQDPVQTNEPIDIARYRIKRGAADGM